MRIGITGRGGTGKTTLAKTITKNHKNFIHIEVDKVIDEKLSVSTELIDRVNNEVGKEYNKKYSFLEIKNSFFTKNDENKKIKKIFLDELNKELLREMSDSSKNYVVEHFVLDEIDLFEDCDYKIKLVAPKEQREERIIKRNDMPLELYRAVDNMVEEEDKTKYDAKFNIEDYQKELISIIVPIYNAEAYIEKTLDSILSQTYKNLEIILVNDGSTDNTKEIIEEYSKKDNRITVINTPNMNVSCARNTGLQYSSGEYVSFIDSDDLINKEYIANLYDALKITDSDFSHAAISVERENSNGYISVDSTNPIVIDDPIKAYLNMDTKFAVWGKLFKKDTIKDIMFDEIPCFEDFKYMWEVAKNSKKAVVISDAIYRYIQRTKNSLTQKKYDDTNKELINHAHKILEDTNNESEEAKKFFYGCILFNVMLFLQSYENNNLDYKYYNEIFECIKLLEEYKDYKFNILEFDGSSIDDIINKAKEIVSMNLVGIFWPPMEENVGEAIKYVKKNQSLQILEA